MSDMTEPDLRRLDFTMLMTFASLMRTRQATAAAAQLGVTQSAVSHALARLRDVMGDPLFTRLPHGLQPTPRAQELAPMVEHLIDLARQTMRGEAFDPASTRRLVRIAGSDATLALIAAPLLERLAQSAPSLQVSFRALVRRAASTALAAGDLDIAIGLHPPAAEGFRSALLWSDSYSVVARKRHPRLRTACTLADYVAERHVLVSNDGDLVGLVDHALAAKGAARKVVASAPYFLMALSMVARTDAVVTLPTAIAKTFAPDFDARIFPCPVAVRPLHVRMLTSARADPLIGWVCERLQDIADDLVAAQTATRTRRKA